MSKKVLWPALAGALALALLVYGCRFFRQTGRPSPEALEQQALTASSSEQREAAAAQLTDWGEASKEHMRRVLAQSGDAPVRSLMIQGLGNIYDYESMELFLAALDDESPLVRGRSAAVVGKMLGRSFPFVADAPENDRRRIAEIMRKDWQGLKDTPLLEDFKQRLKRGAGMQPR